MNSLILYEPFDHCLYAHINKINGKVYFGITMNRTKERWGRGSGYKKGTKIKNAIEKYGWDNFNHIVVLQNLTHKEALDMETHFIKTFKTNDINFGYNTEVGGKEGYLSAEARRKQGEAGVLKPVICLENMKIYDSASDASRDLNLISASIMKACNSKRYILFNYHFMHYSDYVLKTEEEIEHIRKKVPKCIYDDKRSVIALETLEVFLNAEEANRKYPKARINCILGCCKHEKDRYKAGGLHWLFVEEYNKLSRDEIDNILRKKKGFKACKPVIKLETLEIFSSIEEASSSTGLSSKTIRYSCMGTRRTHPKNGHWMFYQEYLTSSKK